MIVRCGFSLRMTPGQAVPEIVRIRRGAIDGLDCAPQGAGQFVTL
jgi:hypothetical protein